MTDISRFRVRAAFLFVSVLIMALGDISPLAAQSAPSPVETKTFQVVGTSPIYQNDTAAARDQAIQAGLAAAVDAALIQVLPMAQLISNFETVSGLFQKERDASIEGYRVLTEARWEKNYRVLIEADILTGRMQQQLVSIGLAGSPRTPLKVMWLVAQQLADRQDPGYWWQNPFSRPQLSVDAAIEKVLQERSLTVLSPDHLLAQTVLDPIRNQAFPDTETATGIGQMLGADVVIIGRAQFKPAANTMGEVLRSFQGQVGLAAIRVRTGAVVARSQEQTLAAAADIYQGSQDVVYQAALLAARSLIPQVLAAWQKEQPQSQGIALAVRGTRDLMRFIKFRQVLAQIDGVKNLQTREIRVDEALLSVAYGGSSQDLAAAIMVSAFDTFGVNIADLADDRIGVVLVDQAVSNLQPRETPGFKTTPLETPADTAQPATGPQFQ